MAAVDLEAYVARSRAIDLSTFPWADVPRAPVSPEAIRTLRYMQDIESHTIIYLRELLSTRAVDDPDVATFLACWLYEESSTGSPWRGSWRRRGIRCRRGAAPGVRSSS